METKNTDGFKWAAIENLKLAYMRGLLTESEFLNLAADLVD